MPKINPKNKSDMERDKPSIFQIICCTPNHLILAIKKKSKFSHWNNFQSGIGIHTSNLNHEKTW